MASILRSVATTSAVVAAASAIPIAIAFSSSSSFTNPKSQSLNFSFLSRSSPRRLGLTRSFASTPMTTVLTSDRNLPQEDRVMPQLLTEFMVDMKCEGCVNAVKNKLETIEGIENVEVDLSNQVVRILGSSPVKAMTQALEQTGRKARLIGQGVPQDRGPSFLDRIPEDLFSVREELAARKCHWIKHFSQGRVEKALRVLHGASCSTSSSSSDQRLSFLTEMQGVKMSLREKKAAEKKARDEERMIRAAFGPVNPPEAIGRNETTVDPDVIVDPMGSGVDLAVTAAHPEVPEGIPIGDIASEVPEAGNTLVVGLLAGGQTRSKRKHPRGEHSGDKRKRSKQAHSSSRPIYQDKVASANLIASCAWPLLPAPEGLVEAERYGETAANFLKAFSSMNTMIHSYDSATRENALAIERSESAKLKAEETAAEAVAAARTAEALVVAEQESRRKESEENARIRQKAEAEIERLKRLLTEEKSLREVEVARAKKAAKREVAEEFQEKVKRTEAKLSEFDKISERYVYLSQAKANAELIAALEAGGQIEDEKLEINKWKEEFGDAEAEYARLGAELLRDLTVPPVSPVSTHDSLENRSVESDAVEVGVTDQAGTFLPPAAAHVEERDG